MDEKTGPAAAHIAGRVLSTNQYMRDEPAYDVPVKVGIVEITPRELATMAGSLVSQAADHEEAADIELIEGLLFSIEFDHTRAVGALDRIAGRLERLDQLEAAEDDRRTAPPE